MAPRSLAILRAAEPRDLPAIVGLIGELAEFEKLTHLLRVTPEALRPHLFGERPAAEAVVAEVDAHVVGFALFFTNFSTFLAQPGLYLEDLFVRPTHRGQGIGEALLRVALDFCRENRVDSAILWPTARSRSLYARHGFATPACYDE